MQLGQVKIANQCEIGKDEMEGGTNGTNVTSVQGSGDGSDSGSTTLASNSRFQRNEENCCDIGCCDPRRPLHRFIALFFMCLLGFGKVKKSSFAMIHSPCSFVRQLPDQLRNSAMRKELFTPFHLIISGSRSARLFNSDEKFLRPLTHLMYT